ncbi:MAG: HAD hydrolase-like protein [Flavobacteriaceae bacterium]|nr:HAD hydrolase-like protein [Flavobacteriaceae bacterium]
MQKKAFIFDLDGVIVDTAKFHYLAWKKLANDLGFDFTETQNEMLKGVSRSKSLEILLGIGNISLPQEQKEKLMDEKKSEIFILGRILGCFRNIAWYKRPDSASEKQKYIGSSGICE